MTRSGLGRQARGADPFVPAPRTAPDDAVQQDDPLHPATGSPWTLLSPEDTVALDLRRGSVRRCVREASVLAPGTWVTVTDDRTMSRWRLRRLARRADLDIERELIVLGGFGAPVAVDEDVEWAVKQFWCSTASHRPQCRPLRPVASMVWPGARRLPWSWTGRIAPGRVVVTRRR